MWAYRKHLPCRRAILKIYNKNTLALPAHECGLTHKHATICAVEANVGIINNFDVVQTLHNTCHPWMGKDAAKNSKNNRIGG